MTQQFVTSIRFALGTRLFYVVFIQLYSADLIYCFSYNMFSFNGLTSLDTDSTRLTSLDTTSITVAI